MARLRRSRAIAAVALFVAPVGCSILVDSSGLTTTARTRTVRDGASANDDSATSDGESQSDGTSSTADGAATDGAAGGDASTDGAPSDGATGVAYAAAVMADSPLMYLRFGESAGATQVKDETGNVQCALIGSPTFGKPGAIANDPNTAVSLGQNGFECGAGFDFVDQEPFSIELWAKLPTFSTTTKESRFLVRKGDFLADGASPAESYTLYFAGDSTGANTIFSRRTGGITELVDPITFPSPDFRHIVAVYNASQLLLYVDGFVRESFQTSQLAGAKVGKFYVGLRDATSGYAQTEIDELAVYGSALADERIKAHYAIGKGTGGEP